MSHLHAVEWITCCALSILSILFSGWLLYDEISKRRRRASEISDLSTRSSKSMDRWSLITILIAPCHALCIALEFFNISCLFTWYFGDTTIFIQQLCVGFYQLSRLQRFTSHGSKYGYPHHLYLVMYCIGGFLFINTFPLLLICDHCLRDQCGIDSEYTYFVEYVPLLSRSQDEKLFYIWSHLYLALVLIWDILTVALYVRKIHIVTLSVQKCTTKYNPKTTEDTESSTTSNKSKSKNSKYSIHSTTAISTHCDPEVQRRVDSALNGMQRVFILTIFYEIGLVLCFFSRHWIPRLFGGDQWSQVVQMLIGIPLSIIFALSMYLMQGHNNRAYSFFLRVVMVLRLHWICCRWRHIIPKQLSVYGEDETITTVGGLNGSNDQEGNLQKYIDESHRLETKRREKELKDFEVTTSGGTQGTDHEGPNPSPPTTTTTMIAMAMASPDTKGDAEEMTMNSDNQNGADCMDCTVKEKSSKIEESDRTRTTTSEIKRHQRVDREFLNSILQSK